MVENVNQIFPPLWAIHPSKSPLTVPDTQNKVILGSFGTRRLTTASFSQIYHLPKTSPQDIIDSLKNLLLRTDHLIRLKGDDDDVWENLLTNQTISP